MTPAAKTRRFYKTVYADKTGEGFRILLDGRAAKTKLGRPLLAPSEALASAIADEWDAQDEHIDFSKTPLSNLLAASIDGGGEGRALWLDDILKYLSTDLVCYRAEEGSDLAARQEAAWAPFIEWFSKEFEATLIVTEGVLAIEQAPDIAKCVTPVLERQNGAVLFGLRAASAISGSAVLALALWRGAGTPNDIFNASRIDERFQEEKWGVDQEAKARENTIRNEFSDVAKFLALLG